MRSVGELACRTLAPADERVFSVTVHQRAVCRPLVRMGETVQLMESGDDGTARGDVVGVGVRLTGAQEVGGPGFASCGGQGGLSPRHLQLSGYEQNITAISMQVNRQSLSFWPWHDREKRGCAVHLLRNFASPAVSKVDVKFRICLHTCPLNLADYGQAVAPRTYEWVIVPQDWKGQPGQATAELNLRRCALVDCREFWCTRMRPLASSIQLGVYLREACRLSRTYHRVSIHAPGVA